MEGEPKIEEESRTQEIQEPQNPKELKWREVEQQLEKFTGIEGGIKETVVGLNVFSIETVNSCEGHNDHGRITPWVSIEKWEGKPRERFVGQKEFEEKAYESLGATEVMRKNSEYLKEHDEKAAEFLPPGTVEFDKLSEADWKKLAEMDEVLKKKHGITDENTRKWMEAITKVEKEVEQAGKDGRLQETEEYKKWKEENDAMKDSAQQLLDEFYKDRKVPKSARIIIDQDGMGMWCIHNGGKDYYDVTRRGEEIPDAEKKHYQEILDGKNPVEEQREMEQRVAGYRSEFQKFAKFCKEKHLGGTKAEARELSPEFVKEVEGSAFYAEDKVYILLVKAGLKPAAGVSFNARVWGDGRDDRLVPEEVTRSSSQMIENSGLFYKREENGGDRQGFTRPDGTDVEYNREHVSFLIAHTQEDLDRIILATEQKNNELMGEGFGYPKTAVEAYLKGKEPLNLDSLPKNVRESPAMLFCKFKLSADNWHEEIKQVQAWADFIKQTSPKVYKEMLKLGMATEKTRTRELAYDKTKEEIEKIPHIEKGVVGIITALNISGIPTSQSCEGHISYEDQETRIVVPHVELGVPNQPEKRFVGQEKLVKKVAEKYGVPAEDVRTTILHNAHWEEFKGAKETEGYKKWRKENKKIAKKADKFLQEFNKDNAAPDHVRLTLNEQEAGYFDISNLGGRQGWQSVGEKDLTPQQKAETNEQLGQYQRHMDDFAKFLRGKYFTKR